MNEQEITQLVQQILSKSQYGVGAVQFHTHNGVDSPRLATEFLSGLISVGNGFSNRGIITDSRITASSVIVANPQSANQATAFSWLSSCIAGSAEVYVNSGISTPPIVFNYIIIL